MTAYIFKRILLMIPTLFGIMLVTFIVTQFVPGGPVEQLVGRIRHSGMGEVGHQGPVLYRGATGLDDEQLAKLKTLYGFDKPAHERFLGMMKNYLQFNLGESYFHHSSVLDLI
ncbi:MAG TPA: microcin ABC transporter permease, partial [Gammaproteobacteria bacterium]